MPKPLLDPCMLTTPIGQNRHHKYARPPPSYGNGSYKSDQLCGVNPTAFFTSLARHRDSLEFIVYAVNGSTPTGVKLPPGCEGFRRFGKLRHTTLEGDCAYFEKALMSEETAPPSLVSLKSKGNMFRLPLPLLSPHDNYQTQARWMTAASTLISTLREVHITTTQTFANRSQKHSEAIVSLGRTFEEQGARLQLFRQRSHGAIAPFLLGEHPDTEELVYGSDSGFSEAYR